MATSEAKICNIALRQLRAERVSSLDDPSREGQLCKELFADARDWVMSAHPWNFALARAALNREANAPAFGFSAAFALPADPYCLRAWKLNGTADAFRADGDRFKIEGRKLLSDVGSANLLYIARVSDVVTWSPGFVQSFAAYLRWQMAYALTASRSVEETSRQVFNELMRKARAIDGAEDFADDIRVSPFVTARY
ncbi:MAG: hypothetical protein HQ495_04440 [Alphaproteobacteria bacterium]|nr:hypothetical protein [Alphaproteobacteria bacterium]